MYTTIEEKTNAITTALFDGKVIRIFYDNITSVHIYETTKSTTAIGCVELDIRNDSALNEMIKSLRDLLGIGVCSNATHIAPHLRLRILDIDVANMQTISNVIRRYIKQTVIYDQPQEKPKEPEKKPKEPETPKTTTTIKEKGTHKMKDFSLTNLKDAVINKVTNLDKKTISILAIIALILLIVCRYNDLKDIAKGIKDKITKSKNFKAMKEDANAALDSLKKIIGIKKGANNES